MRVSVPALVAAGLLAAACESPEEEELASSQAVITTVVDQWSPAEAVAPVYLVGEEGGFFSPVHATLMPDGKVMFLGMPFPKRATSSPHAEAVAPRSAKIA